MFLDCQLKHVLINAQISITYECMLVCVYLKNLLFYLPICNKRLQTQWVQIPEHM